MQPDKLYKLRRKCAITKPFSFTTKSLSQNFVFFLKQKILINKIFTFQIVELLTLHLVIYFVFFKGRTKSCRHITEKRGSKKNSTLKGLIIRYILI